MQHFDDYSPRLQKQRSCTCVPIDHAAAIAGGSWSHSRRFLTTATVGLGRSTFGINNDYSDDIVGDELDPLYFRPGRAVAAAKGWRGLWRRIMMKGKKIFPSNSSSQVPPYDPYTYAQNFDDGPAWDVEPEILSRSFSARFASSARFAVPARVFQR